MTPTPMDAAEMDKRFEWVMAMVDLVANGRASEVCTYSLYLAKQKEQQNADTVYTVHGISRDGKEHFITSTTIYERATRFAERDAPHFWKVVICEYANGIERGVVRLICHGVS